MKPTCYTYPKKSMEVHLRNPISISAGGWDSEGEQEFVQKPLPLIIVADLVKLKEQCAMRMHKTQKFDLL